MRPWFRLSATALTAAVVFAAGCGGPAAFVPVTGTVTLDGKPLADAEVVFVPDPSKGTKGDNASGFTDAQGRFALRAGRTGKDGAAPGFYRVVVTDTAGVADSTSPGSAPGDGMGGLVKGADPKRPKLAAVYSDLSQTPLRDVEVKPDNPMLIFDLKASGR